MKIRTTVVLFNFFVILALTLVGALVLYHLSKVPGQGPVTRYLVALVLVSLGSILGSIIFATWLTVPIRRISEAFGKMAKGDLEQPVITMAARNEFAEMSRAFNAVVSTLKQIRASAMEVARGNLGISFEAKGEIADALRHVVDSQRALVEQLAETAVQLTAAINEFQSNAEQQERGAVEQSSAVEENRRTMDSLLESSRQVSATAQGVLDNAERTQQNSRLVAERITALSSHTHRIAEILQVIKDIANKSDLLALNAALEGTKAGESGRGFSLVASQMQRLAENVMAAVKDIKELTRTITESTRATVLAIEESTKLSADTTRSARQIVMIIQQQNSGTEQMTRSLDDVAQIARGTAIGSKQIVASTVGLSELSSRLQVLVERYSTATAPNSNQDRAQ